MLVDAVHEFAPTYDLPDEAFEGVEWNLFSGGEGGIDDLSGGEKADVQHGCEDGVVDEGVLGGDCVFVGAKFLEAFLNELGEPLFCLGTGGWIAERTGGSGVFREVFVYKSGCLVDGFGGFC